MRISKEQKKVYMLEHKQKIKELVEMLVKTDGIDSTFMIVGVLIKAGERSHCISFIPSVKGQTAQYMAADLLKEVTYATKKLLEVK